MMRKRGVDTMKSTAKNEQQITILTNSRERMKDKSMLNILRSSTKEEKLKKCTPATKTQNFL